MTAGGWFDEAVGTAHGKRTDLGPGRTQVDIPNGGRDHPFGKALPEF